MSLYIKAKELREKRADAWANAQNIHKAAKGESRGLNDDESAQFDKADAEIRDLTTKIETVEGEIQAQEDRAALLESVDNGPGRDDATSKTAQAASGGLRAWMCGGQGSLTPEQRAGFRFEQTDRGPGLTIRAFRTPEQIREEARAQSVGTDSAGGYTVAEGFAGTLVDSMQAFGGMRQARTTKLRTEKGGDLPISTGDDTGNTGALLGENTQDSEQDLTFGVKTLGAYKYTSKIVRVSWELLQDSEFNIEAHLGKKLGERLGRIHNTQFTTGTGSSQPQGVVVGSGLGKTAAAVAAIVFDEFLDLKHSVDPAMRANAEFMFNDSTLKEIKKLSVGSSDARPLWQPSPIVGEPDTIDGDPYVINQDMASIATGNKVALYGDFSYYWIRDVRDITLIRLTERYADYGQVAFLAFSRNDGALVDPGDNPINHLIMA